MDCKVNMFHITKRCVVQQELGVIGDEVLMGGVAGLVNVG